jgi:hypothetical protein
VKLHLIGPFSLSSSQLLHPPPFKLNSIFHPITIIFPLSLFSFSIFSVGLDSWPVLVSHLVTSFSTLSLSSPSSLALVMNVVHPSSSPSPSPEPQFDPSSVVSVDSWGEVVDEQVDDGVNAWEASETSIHSQSRSYSHSSVPVRTSSSLPLAPGVSPSILSASPSSSSSSAAHLSSVSHQAITPHTLSSPGSSLVVPPSSSFSTAASVRVELDEVASQATEPDSVSVSPSSCWRLFHGYGHSGAGFILDWNLHLPSPLLQQNHSDSEETEDKGEGSRVRCLARYDRQGDQSNELNISTGDTFTIIAEMKGWMCVRQDRTGKVGMVPSNCLTLIDVLAPCSVWVERRDMVAMINRCRVTSACTGLEGQTTVGLFLSSTWLSSSMTASQCEL